MLSFTAAVTLRIGLRIGFDSLAFIYYSLVIFGLLYFIWIIRETSIDHQLFYAYLLSIFAALFTYNCFAKKTNQRDLIRFNNKLDTSRSPFCIFIIYISIQAVQVFLTNEAGGGGARQDIYKIILPASILHDVIQGIAYLYITFKVSRNQYLPFAIVLCLNALSGSKAMCLYFILEIVFLARVLYGHNFLGLFWSIFLGGIAFLFSYLLYYQGDKSFEDLDGFLRYRGDVYFYLFEMGFRENLFDTYNWATYFLHHTFKIFGSSIYEGPIGTALFSFAFNIPLSQTTGGPITPFFVVADVLAGGASLPSLLIIGFFAGGLSASLFNYGVKEISKTDKIIPFALGYWCLHSYFIITDPTVFSYRITPVLLIYIGYSIARYIRYTRHA